MKKYNVIIALTNGERVTVRGAVKYGATPAENYAYVDTAESKIIFPFDKIFYIGRAENIQTE